jgi:nickel/cobalt transporter (NicO) family protein
MLYLTAPGRRWLLTCLGLVLAIFSLMPPKEAEAHPLGNFTINHYSRLEFSDEAARVTYVLDFAEIPTLQQKELLDADGDGKLSDEEAAAYLDAELPSLLKGLRLEVGDEVLPLQILDSSARYRPGQGGLPTLRIEARLLTDLPDNWMEHGAGHYADRNYEDRLGWREIVVKGGSGVAIESSTVPSADVSNELRAYPQDSLSSPLDRREANFMLVPRNGSSTGDAVGQAAESVSTGNVDGSISSRVTSLISVDRLSATVIAISMLAALLWGAAHALTPGHGKAVVAAYLIGARGTIRHAGILGLTVTLTHTAGVFALGGVTLYLSRYILPEDLYPWLSVVSGLLVVAIGLFLLYGRLRGALTPDIAEDQHTHAGHPGAGVAHPHGVHERPYGDHQHSHVGKHSGHTHFHDGHVHNHSHDGHIHSHLPPGADGSKVTWRSLLALGVSGGLVPCPAALVLLLSAISLGRLGFGMVLVVAFSVGLALVLTGIGVLMIYAKRLFERFSFEARVPRLLPVASALAILLVGLLIVLEALRQAGTV